MAPSNGAESSAAKRTEVEVSVPSTFTLVSPISISTRRPSAYSKVPLRVASTPRLRKSEAGALVSVAPLSTRASTVSNLRP